MARCLFYAFVAMNALFWLMGCGLLTFGVFLHINKGPYIDGLAPGFSYINITILIIICGGMGLLVGFLGCCGAIFENRCMLLAYFLMVSITLILETVMTIMVYIYKIELRELMEEELIYSIRSVYPRNHRKDYTGIRKTWDEIQYKFECCGVSKYTDWYYSSGWPGKRFVPDSCCNIKLKGCGKSKHVEDWHKKGCLDEILKILSQYLHYLWIVCCVVSNLQLFGITVSLILYRIFGKKPQKRSRTPTAHQNVNGEVTRTFV